MGPKRSTVTPAKAGVHDAGSEKASLHTDSSGEKVPEGRVRGHIRHYICETQYFVKGEAGKKKREKLSPLPQASGVGSNFQAHATLFRSKPECVTRTRQTKRIRLSKRKVLRTGVGHYSLNRYRSDSKTAESDSGSESRSVRSGTAYRIRETKIRIIASGRAFVGTF